MVNLFAMRTDLHLMNAALDLFAAKGFHATSMREIAERAGVSPGLAYKYHPSKEALAMVLYGRIAERFAATAPDLPAGTIVQRFRAAMSAKLALITPHRSALRALAARAVDPTDRLGVLGPRAATVRSRNSGVFALVVEGATDRPVGPERARLARLLYGAHLAIVGTWTQDESPDNPRANGVLELVCQALQALPLLVFLPGGGDLLARADGIFGDTLGSSLGADAERVVDLVLSRVFERRRSLTPSDGPPTEAALALHRPVVRAAIEAGEPVHLVLPAFPAKSPNRAKTLGPLPDLAETIALRGLQELCDAIAEAHPPGARLTIASDGHVFADLVEVPDAEVDAYQDAIAAIVRTEELASIDLFDLRDVFGALSGDAARAELVRVHALPIEALRQRAEEHPRHRAMADGIHRFLFEDAVVLHPERSRTTNRTLTRDTSWATIQRSEAWGRLVAEAFPKALRLSIHPQPEVSEKIGVHLLPTEDAWLTPWHGVAVLTADQVTLMKRADAEAHGAQQAGDHYVLQ